MASFWEQFTSIFKGTTKKKKKKDTPRRRSFVSEKAKKETHKPAKRSAPTPSRKGRQANPEVVKRGQTLGTQAVNRQKQYQAYEKKKKKAEAQHDREYGKTTLITPKRGGYKFYKANNRNATFASNTKGNNGAYKNPTDFYKKNKGEQEYVKKKTEAEYKNESFNKGLKDAIMANFLGDEPEAKKIEKRIGTKINVDLNNEQYQKGKQTGDFLSYAAPGGLQGRISKGILKGANVAVKATTKASRVAPKLGKSIKMTSKAKTLAKKIGARYKVKAVKKGYTKMQDFKASMQSDALTSTPLNVSNASVESKRITDENKETKKTLAKNIKETNKQIEQVRKSQLPAKVKRKYLKQLNASKAQMQKQSKSLSTNQNLEFAKQFAINETMDRVLGAGLSGLTAKGVTKVAQKAKVGSKAKVRKIALGENLEKVRAKANADIAKAEAKETAENVVKRNVRKGKVAKSASGEVKGRTVVYKNKKTGETIYEGSPQTPEQQRTVLRHAIKEAGGAKNLDVTTKEVGSPQATHRQPTSKLQASGETVETSTIKESIDNTAPRKASENNEVPTGEATTPKSEPTVKEPVSEKPKTDAAEQLRKLDNAKAKQADDLADLQRQAGTYKTGRNVLGKLDEANTKQAKELTDARKITGFSNKATTRKAIKQGEAIRASERAEQSVEPVPETPKQKSSIEYKRDLRDLEKRRGTMSARKYEAEKADIEAKRAEAKAREDIEAKKAADKKRAREIERKPAKDRTPDDVRQIVEDKENAPIARINTKIKHADTKFDKIAFRKLKTGLQKAFVDSGAAFENMARDAIKAGRKEEGEALYSAVNSLRQTEKSVQYQLFDAQTDFNYKRVGESAHDIVKPLDRLGKKTGKDVYADTQAMLFHQHNVDRMKNGKPVFGEAVDGIRSQNEIKRIRDKYTDKELKVIDAQIDKIHKYFDNLRTMRREAGLISKELDDYLKELYPNYVPTKRAGDFGIEAKGEFNTATGKVEEADHGVVGAPGGKEATGSNKDLLSIEDQMYRATKEVWSASKTNNLVQKVMELQGFKGNKLDVADLGEKADGTERTFEDVISESLFATGDKSSGFRLRWFDDGVAKSAKCTEEVYNSLKALNGQGMNLPTWAEYAEKALDVTAGTANSLFKKLCTEWNPFFALYRNPMRDIQDAFMYSKDFKGFIAHMPTAIKRMANQDEYWQLWKASGGTQSSLFDITSKIKKSKNPLRRVGLLNQAVEQYPRFTEFCSILDKELKGAPVSSATREMIDKASQAGADITVNFGRSGDVTKVFNRYLVPFLNPGVQGVSKGVRLITERSGAKAFVSLATKAAALGFAPAVINEALLGDDNGYKQMNARDKMTNYILKVGGNYIKIPKGRLLSLIGMGGLKATNNFMGGSDYSLEEMKDVAMNQSAPANPLSDNIAMTAHNALNNKTWYGGNIQSDYDEDEQKAQWRIYDADTTSLAKKLAKTDFFKTIENDKGVVGVSPKKIDAMLKGYTGVLGELAMPLMAQRAKGAGVTGSIKNLAKKTFTIDPRYQNRFSTDFYDKVNETARKADDTHNKKDEKESKYYGDQSKRISTFNKVINEVQGSNLSYSEKNKIVDALQDEKNKVMKGAIDHKNPESGFDMDDMKSVYESSGAKYAIKYFVKDSDKKDTKSYAKKHDLGDIIDVNRKLDRAGFPTTRSRQPKIKALAIEEGGKGNKDLYKYFNVDKSTRNMIKKYHDAGGNIKELSAVQKNIEKTAKTIGKEANKLPKGALAYALSAASGKNRIYQMYDESTVNSKEYWRHSVLSGKGMDATGLTLKDRQKAYDACKGATGHCSKDAIINYLDKKNWTKEQKSYMFWQLANWNTKENPYGDYTPKYKAKDTTSSTKSKGKSGQIDYSTPEAKRFFNNFGANMSKERLELAQKLYKAAKASKKGINAPYSNDKDYLPKETLQVVRSGDKELDAEALKALKNGGLKNIIRKANATLPKVKEPEDSDSIFGDGKEGSSSGGGYYRRYGRGYRRYGRGGGGRGGSGGGTTDTGIDEVKATPNKTKTYNWTPKDFESKPGWTDAQIRKVFNTLIKQGLTEQQAVSRIASLWNTRFS